MSFRYPPRMGGGMVAALTGLMLAMTWPTLAAASAPSPDSPFIAGVRPDRRPEAAPVLKAYDKDAAWYDRALHGVSEPYPYSLKFLEDQGAWFTPFIHPGMTPPYDIRHWHRSATRRTGGVRGRTRRARRR